MAQSKQSKALEVWPLPNAKVNPMIFEYNIQSVSHESIARVIRELLDEDLVQESLDKVFGGAVIVKKEFAAFPFRGIDLLVAISEARFPVYKSKARKR